MSPLFSAISRPNPDTDRSPTRYERLFPSAYVFPDGTMTSDSQTAYALALQFALVREPGAAAFRRPSGSPTSFPGTGIRIGSGFLGTPIICDALCSVGRVRRPPTGCSLERSCPSWLYPVTMGATTIWERWDSLLPDGSVNPGQMTSFNHYAFGAVADWLHRTVAGLAPDSARLSDGSSIAPKAEAEG